MVRFLNDKMIGLTVRFLDDLTGRLAFREKFPTESCLKNILTIDDSRA
jgi:hypothetical protein